MNLDEQLSQLLASLGVVLEEPRDAAPSMPHLAASQGGNPHQAARNDAVRARDEEAEGDVEVNEEAYGEPEISLFQTSREHYGVFYRLDLIGAAPQLRIFAPEDAGALKMRCYLVRAAIGSPVRDWFLATRAHDGSAAFDETRETTEQHLLFAAGEALKRLFWLGDQEGMRFPDEIEVCRLV